MGFQMLFSLRCTIFGEQKWTAVHKMMSALFAKQITAAPCPGVDYELFNSSNICICSWSWNYRSCWHQTCPPVDTHWIVWIAFIAEFHPPHRVSRAAMARRCLAKPVSAVDNLRMGLFIKRADWGPTLGDLRGRDILDSLMTTGQSCARLMGDERWPQEYHHEAGQSANRVGHPRSEELYPCAACASCGFPEPAAWLQTRRLQALPETMLRPK